MRALRMVVAIAATLALLTAPASAAPAGTPSGEFVVGGGQRINPQGVPNRTFSVDARSLPGGEASGNYTFLSLSDPARPPFSFTARVTCVDVVGNLAVIGGTITGGNFAVGAVFLVFFIDNGDPVGGQLGPDMVSQTYVGTGGEFGNVDEVLTEGEFSVFPATCPDAAHDHPGLGEFPGEFSVQGNFVVGAGQLWDPDADFRLFPDQMNPSPDSYGNAGVWSYKQSSGFDHDPTQYELLPNYDAGLLQWNNPAFVNLIVGYWPGEPRALLLHAFGGRVISNIRSAILAWQSPVAGFVTVTGTVELPTSCGDGIILWIDKGAQSLQTIVLPTGSQAFALTTQVEPGESIYFIVDPGYDSLCDSTLLRLTIIKG